MAKIIPIRSENADFQHAETLRRNREKRQRHREFVLEGVRPINQALRHGWRFNALLFARGRQLSGWARGVLDAAAAPTHYELAPELMAKLSGKDEASELLAIVAMPEDDLGRIPLRPGLLAVIFDRPASPGNLGTLIRSCDALGADGLIITGHAADLYDPETISATTGSLFALPAVRVPSPRALEPWFAQARDALGDLQIVGSDEAGEREAAAHDWLRPTVLVLGNETWGMSAHYRQRCDAIVRIPIGGSASSLNVACSGSILLYEIARQRRGWGGGEQA